jgi:hypothetical protein
VSVIRLTVRIILKLTVIRIKYFLNRTNTSSRGSHFFRQKGGRLFFHLGRRKSLALRSILVTLGVQNAKINRPNNLIEAVFSCYTYPWLFFTIFIIILDLITINFFLHVIFLRKGTVGVLLFGPKF